jgi:hypothetical protein
MLLIHMKNVVELENTKNMRDTLATVIEYLKVTLGKDTIKFLGKKVIFTAIVDYLFILKIKNAFQESLNDYCF